jgi:hypothetical protein
LRDGKLPEKCASKIVMGRGERLLYCMDRKTGNIFVVIFGGSEMVWRPKL